MVEAKPIETGIPVHLNTVFIISLHFLLASSSENPLNFINASSILYISTSGTCLAIIDITLLLISPYNVKLEEKIWTLFFCKISLYLNAGAPMGIPSDFASLLLAITHPSLFDKITSGLPFK